MPQTIHSTKVITPFGAGYVPEDHGPGPTLREPKKRSGAGLAIVLTIALFGVTTAAAAISVSNRDCGAVPKLWLQNPPSVLMKLPGTVGFDDLLF
jgi:hypothetical protein